MKPLLTWATYFAGGTAFGIVLAASMMGYLNLFGVTV